MPDVPPVSAASEEAYSFLQLRQQNDSLRAENDSLKAEVERLREEGRQQWGEFRLQADDLRSTLETVERERGRCEQDYKKAIKLCDSLRQQLADLQKQNPTP